MSVNEWCNAEFGYTMLWLSEHINYLNDKHKAEQAQRLEDHKINRLNTFYIMKSFGASEIKSPAELYTLDGDDIDTEQIDDDPFSDEMNELFDNFI